MASDVVTPSSRGENTYSGKLGLLRRTDSASNSFSAISSIALGGALFLAIGVALNWKVGFLVTASLGFSLSTWLARSLVRALICMFSALGLLAAGMTVIASIDANLAASLGVGWPVMFVMWWLVTVVLSGCLRGEASEPEFGAGPMVGAALAILIATVISIKIDFGSSLLLYLTAFEDNAAWVGLTTGLEANAASIGGSFTGSTLGPLMPLMLGTLGSAQRSGTPWVNSVFASYSLAIILSPLVAASVVRGMVRRPWWVTVSFTLIAFAWAFVVPATLFLEAGHLSATWAFLGVLLLISFWTFDRNGAWVLPVGLGVAAFVGASWFPIAPLAGLIAAAIAVLSVRSSSKVTRVAVIGGTGLVIVAFLVQLDRSGVGIGSNAAGLVDSIRGLYTSQGGTAELDGLLVAVVLGGITLLAFSAKGLGEEGMRLSTILLVILGFLIAIYVVSFLLQVPVPDSYGIKKLTYILGYASLIALIGGLARANIDGRPLLAVVAVLAFTSLTYGGGGQLLQRSWPGEGSKPDWLGSVEAAIDKQDARHPRPVVCFSPEPTTAYLCTRWAGALTTAGDGAFLDYRLDAIHNASANWKAILRELNRNGTLKRSDAIFLNQPVDGTPWGWVLARKVGRLFGPYGNRLPRPATKAKALW